MTSHGHGAVHEQPSASADDDVPRVRRSDGPLFSFDRTLPGVGRVAFDIPRPPGQHYLEAVVDFVDTKLPTIKGRPAIRECLANLKPGITVSLVSLPLSISLAIAADATPVQGIITAAWAGLVASVMGGSHYNIVGPTGALSGILSYYSVTYGAAIQPLLSLLAGILSLLVWVFKVDKYLVFIPGAVMHGFTLGVAFIISANQLNFLLGLPKLKRHPEFMMNIAETFSNIGAASPFAIAFFAVSFMSLFNLVRKYGKIPWAVLLALIGIIIGAIADAAQTSLPIQTIRTRYGDLSVQLVDFIDMSKLPVTADTFADVIRGSVSIAAVAVLETLISARIADRMTKTIFNQSREVLAVGLSNLASGFAGGIPATAALARTALNVKSGATSRGAGIVNAIMVFLLSSVLFSAFKFLPLPVVATILVNTAYRMVEWHEIHILLATDKAMFVVAIVTGLICVVEDPTMGIVYGTGLSMIRTLLAMMHGHGVVIVFQGARQVYTHTFNLNDGRVAVAAARAEYLGERDPNLVAREKAAIAAGEAVASSFNSIAAAASALKLAQDDAKAVASSIAATAAGRTTKARVSRDFLPSSAGAQTSNADGEEGGEKGEEEEIIYLRGSVPMPGDERLPRVAVYDMPGYCTYVAAQSHLDRIRALFINAGSCLPEINVVAFNLSECKYSDPDSLEAIGDVVSEMARVQKTVYLLGVSPFMSRILTHVPWSQGVVCFADYKELLEVLREALTIDGERLAASTSEGGAPAPTLAELVVSRIRSTLAAPPPVTSIAIAAEETASSGVSSSSPSSAVEGKGETLSASALGTVAEERGVTIVTPGGASVVSGTTGAGTGANTSASSW